MLEYLSVETSCGRLWVAYEDDRVSFSLLGVQEEEFVRACEQRLGEAPQRSAQPAVAATVQARLEQDTPIAFNLDRWTAFQRDVLNAVAGIPRGEVRTYAQVASAVGRPGAARAVGEVMRTNPIPVLIPCHRVVRTGGSIGNYSPHPDLKRRFLIEEGAIAG